MTNNEKAIQVIMEAIDEVNEQLPKEEKLEKSINTVLFGNEGNLDSLRMVSLVTTVEQKIEDKFSTTITLLEDIAALEYDNPFRTVGSLADYITSLLEKTAIE